MKILLRRIARRPNYTIGKLYVDGKYFCDTLEDTDRGLTSSMSKQEIEERKIKANTAIPIGKYEVTVTFSPRFNKYMPLLLGVKGFEGIRVHSGNGPEDTEGCILVGLNKKVGQVLESRVTYNKLFKVIDRAFKKNELIMIEIC